MKTREVLGHIDCPACGHAAGMRITHDRNGHPFGYCEASCSAQLRIGGDARRLAAFLARFPWAAGTGAAGAGAPVRGTGTAAPAAAAKAAPPQPPKAAARAPAPAPAPATAPAPAPAAPARARNPFDDAYALLGIKS